MNNLKSYQQLFEAKVDIQEIKRDLDGFRISGSGDSQPAEISGDSVYKDFRDVGNWIHDEDRGYESEEDGDMNWREDDDQMLWAPEEYKKYSRLFTAWASNKPWFNDVRLDIQTSEKNWVTFQIFKEK